MSRPVRGAWIETEARALLPPATGTSRPVRGAWIETAGLPASGRFADGRAPCGARGLKRRERDVVEVAPGRAPCGARGLKRLGGAAHGLEEEVAPRAGRVD